MVKNYKTNANVTSSRIRYTHLKGFSDESKSSDRGEEFAIALLQCQLRVRGTDNASLLETKQQTT